MAPAPPAGEVALGPTAVATSHPQAPSRGAARPMYSKPVARDDVLAASFSSRIGPAARSRLQAIAFHFVEDVVPRWTGRAIDDRDHTAPRM